MGFGEMFKYLAQALQGSHKDVDNNEKKTAKTSGELESDPRAIYERVKALLLDRQESREEKETRLLNQWITINRPQGMSHVVYQLTWDRLISEMEAAGLARSTREAYVTISRSTAAESPRRCAEGSLWTC